MKKICKKCGVEYKTDYIDIIKKKHYQTQCNTLQGLSIKSIPRYYFRGDFKR